MSVSVCVSVCVCVCVCVYMYLGERGATIKGHDQSIPRKQQIRASMRNSPGGFQWES